VITENANLGKRSRRKTSQASTSTDPIPTPVIYRYNQMNGYFEKNFTGYPFGYYCDICDRIWYMNDLKQVKEKHISVQTLMLLSLRYV
jgi:hypothetical protein